ncbi:hypothetical protein DICVIV_10263 [Dictyocaulus viviparus]|uniref:Uncharacterized protein n=1 Tax=Dictyocaulus viviparus TaxID=29172 RepID=A0A0D8XJ15_DICVI|nr:hypothetical protein DICVIV_10263 [Dictyocaulus viviparus]
MYKRNEWQITNVRKSLQQSGVKRNGFLNNYGYGPHGVGPANIGVDSFGFFKDKFYNSGMPPLYTHAAYRNYYHEISFHKNKYGLPAPTNFDILQQERFGKYEYSYCKHCEFEEIAVEMILCDTFSKLIL